MRRTRSSIVCASVLLAFTAGNPRGITLPTQTAATSPAKSEAARCEALFVTDFGGIPDAPTRVVSARLVDVPAADPKVPPTAPAALLAASPVKQYCQVLGYVAPQNKFELRLPLPAQWNGRFHLTPCAGFCGAVNGNACNLTLARGYASITGNGGHIVRSDSTACGRPTVRTCKRTSPGGTITSSRWRAKPLRPGSTNGRLRGRT
jgi:feruloyl esterase